MFIRENKLNCVSVGGETGQGSPTWGLRNSPVSTVPGRKLPGWTVRNCGEGTPSGLTVRPRAAGQVGASPVLLCRTTQARRSVSPSVLRRQWRPGQPPSEGALSDPKACVAAASARGLGTGHLQDMSPPGLPWPLEDWLHNTPQPEDTTPPAAALRPSRPAGSRLAQPPGDSPQVLARRVLVRGSVTVLRLRWRDPAHRPR